MLQAAFFKQCSILMGGVEWQYGDNNMTLIEAIRDLEKHEAEATIYAAKPWNEDSLALVALDSNDGKLPVAAESLSYFLEVFVARDFLEDWIPSVDEEPTLQDRCARLIQYAINDT